MNIVFTIAAKNYLASALTLRESVLACNKEVQFYIVLADEDSEHIIEQNHKCNIIKAASIGIENYEDMAFKYDVVEFNTSVKPFFFRYAFQELGADKVVYLDPDIYVYKSLNTVFDSLDQASIILTPHVVDGAQRITIDSQDKVFLKYGIYNLGFVGIKNCLEGLDITKWWCARLAELCYMDDVYFVDQKWMNYIPALFSKVLIERGKCYNIAWWNFTERELADGENIKVHDGNEWKDIVFVHFSNFKPGMNFDYFESRGIFVGDKQKEILHSLYNEYEKALLKNGFDFYSRLPYSYNYFENGCQIEKINRRLYRIEENRDRFKNSLFSLGENTFYNYLKKNNLLSVVNTKKVAPEKIISKSRRKEKGKKEIVFEICLRILKNFVGIRKYQNIINTLQIKFSIDNQDFLLKKK